ncbi:Leucine-rich repeat (LRR) protein associated with apoptosis in muscle tissue [Handroanthus impetiginosus]|uniref:Cell wall hydroxyproline-rich glycoprotein n=1 Tax=Handroanthus impetiginosus TaxID=429701 RepID=A0A2G9H9Y2_9LAMI|nr:Leucine-rich repeat (LRR) protein associated with apoptosis in muscle tissue [Handroanthus impetiginosus]
MLEKISFVFTLFYSTSSALNSTKQIYKNNKFHPRPINPISFTHQCGNLHKQVYQIPNIKPSFTELNMENIWVLAFFLPIFVSTEASMIVGGGVGIGVGGGIGSAGGGGGGGGVWIGGGINPPTPPSSNLNMIYTALQTWKSAIADDPLGVLNSWVGPNVCSYKGVFCSETRDFIGNPVGTVVSAIDLNHANLQGTLVKELCFLTELSILHLNSNRFSGGVPLSFRQLESLTELDLSNNHFSGPFPTPILYIPNLVYLDLRFNTFSGPIPPELFNKKLDAIFLNNNLFTGQLPDNLGNSPASVINLANNKFTGTIPFSLSYMGIKEILFLNNQLTGCIPEGVGMWTDLQVLDVSSNSLMGHLPDSLSCLSSIEVLNLAHNKLSGDLSDLVCSLRNLLNLSVAANFFSGISQDCNKLSFRNVGFDFSLNCIPGKEMQRPEPDCSLVPGDGLSCLRIISPKPIVCVGILGAQLSANSTP